MREFGVARVTVRQAMELLARDGLVSAERGRGTFVMAQPVRDRGLRLETSLQALADVYRNDTPNLTLIEEAAATPQLFERDGAPASAYRFMRRIHSRNGETYCVISIFLDERVFRMAPRRFRRNGHSCAARPAARNGCARVADTRDRHGGRDGRASSGHSCERPGCRGATRMPGSTRHGHLSRRSDVSRRLHSPRDGPEAVTTGAEATSQ